MSNRVESLGRCHRLQEYRVRRWVNDSGDSTLRIDYKISENDIIFDVGGYLGNWSLQIAEKYNPYIFIFEPVQSYYREIVSKTLGNPKIKVFNFALGDSTRKDFISIGEDASKVIGEASGDSDEISVKKFSDFVFENKISKIRLIKINIEGGEYPLLDDIFRHELQNIITEFQIQFHDFFEDSDDKLANFREMISRSHRPTYIYNYVWENWIAREALGDSDSLAQELVLIESFAKTQEMLAGSMCLVDDLQKEKLDFLQVLKAREEELSRIKGSRAYRLSQLIVKMIKIVLNRK